MPTVTSSDGTTIAYERSGSGPPVILVDGALSYRAYLGSRPLAAQLARDFTAITYDRRGRGESGDTPPYAVEREIEDIAALIDAAGRPVFLYGPSSGAVLALKAAARLARRVAKIALYEPPFDTSDQAVQEYARYRQQMDELLSAGRRGDAVALFLSDMLPADALAGLRQSPEWSQMEAVAHTLAYDNALLGDGSIPLDDARAANMPALVLDGDATLAFLHDAANALAAAMPRAQRETLTMQTHQPSPEKLAPVLAAFFKA